MRSSGFNKKEKCVWVFHPVPQETDDKLIEFIYKRIQDANRVPADKAKKQFFEIPWKEGTLSGVVISCLGLKKEPSPGSDRVAEQLRLIWSARGWK